MKPTKSSDKKEVKKKVLVRLKRRTEKYLDDKGLILIIKMLSTFGFVITSALIIVLNKELIEKKIGQYGVKIFLKKSSPKPTDTYFSSFIKNATLYLFSKSSGNAPDVIQELAKKPEVERLTYLQKLSNTQHIPENTVESRTYLQRALAFLGEMDG